MTESPEGWAEARLGDIGVEVRGFVTAQPGTTYELYSVPTFPTGKPQIADGAAIGSGKRPVEPGDVLLCKINPRINRVWRVAEPLGLGPQLASTEYLVLRVADAAVARFLMWYFRGPRFRAWIELAVEGATGSHTRAKSGPILDQRVPIPPRTEQERIVAAIEEQFSRLDDAETSLRRARRQCPRLRAGVLRDQLTGEWETAAIGEIASVGSGATPRRDRPEYYDGGTIPWVTSGQLTHEFVDEATEYITERALSETSVKLWPAGTLLVAMYGEGRTRGHCSELRFASTTNQACAAIVLRDDGLVRREFLKLVLRARYEEHRRLASGGVQPNLSLGIVKAMKIPLPPLDEQRRIVAEIERQLSILDSLGSAIDRALERSRQLRRAILERAFTGRLVSQDPSDEPASLLLERIAAERAAKPPARRGRRRARMEAT